MAETIDFTGLRPTRRIRGRTAALRGMSSRTPLAHAAHVPFENIEVLMGRPVRLDRDSLWKKLVEDRRGGFASNRTRCSPRRLSRLDSA